MKNLFYCLTACLLLASCESTKVLYDAKVRTEIETVGIANLDKEPKHGKLFPKLDSNFRVSSMNFAKRFIAKQPVLLNEKISCSEPDVSKIKELCEKNKLDGVILACVQFRQVINNIPFLVRNSKYFESIVYTKLYDKNGNMLYSIVHDSKEDYDKTPTTYDEVNMSLGITFQKINKISQKGF